MSLECLSVDMWAAPLCNSWLWSLLPSTFFFWFNMAVSWVNGNVQSDTRMRWFDDAGRAESLFSYIQSFSMPERLLR